MNGRDTYHLTIHWVTFTDTGDETVIEKGDFPVRVQAHTPENARQQVLIIADRMGYAFSGTNTTFFYKIREERVYSEFL